MPAQIIDGKAIAADVRNQVRLDIEQRISAGQRAPGLAVILVGANPASQVYVRKKREACDEAGLISKSFDLDENTDQQTLLDLIEDLNEDGFPDPDNPTLDDLPMIKYRIDLIDDQAPHAMDKTNADAFAEARKDLVNMVNRLTR